MTKKSQPSGHQKKQIGEDQLVTKSRKDEPVRKGGGKGPRR